MISRRRPAIAPWWRGYEPVVVYADEHMVAAVARSPVAIVGMNVVGWWWMADDGWHGPYKTDVEARRAGRQALSDAASQGRRW